LAWSTPHAFVRDAEGTARYLAQTHDIGPTVLAMTGVRRPQGWMNGHVAAPRRAPPASALVRVRRLCELATRGTTAGRSCRTTAAAAAGLYDLARGPLERDNVARRHPRVIDDLYRRVVRQAGRRPPIYRS
jgi:hypothetical protein